MAVSLLLCLQNGIQGSQEPGQHENEGGKQGIQKPNISTHKALPCINTSSGFGLSFLVLFAAWDIRPPGKAFPPIRMRETKTKQTRKSTYIPISRETSYTAAFLLLWWWHHGICGFQETGQPECKTLGNHLTNTPLHIRSSQGISYGGCSLVVFVSGNIRHPRNRSTRVREVRRSHKKNTCKVQPSRVLRDAICIVFYCCLWCSHQEIYGSLKKGQHKCGKLENRIKTLTYKFWSFGGDLIWRFLCCCGVGTRHRITIFTRLSAALQKGSLCVLPACNYKHSGTVPIATCPPPLCAAAVACPVF